MRQIWTMLILISLVACNRSDNNQSAVREAITQYNAQLQEAYVRGDAELIASLMTDSVVVSPVGFGDLVGRKSVQNLLEGFFQGGNAVSKYQFSISELEVYGNIAYDRGTFVWEAAGKDGSKLNTSGRYSAVRMKGSDGSWRIHRLIENELPAAQRM